ncbi:MAG: ABC transporter substrate-binding protein [Actinomycetota bacterium]
MISSPHASITRLLAVLAVLALVAIACSDGDDTDASSSDAEASASEPAATDDADDASTADSEPAVRTMEHVGGTTDVPTDPQNILALDEYTALMMWDLGVEPATVYHSLLTVYTEPIADAFGVELIEHALAEPAIEASAALAPDLIVSFAHPTTLDSYDTWAEVGPMFIYADADPWRDQFLTVGDALGAEDAAARRIAELDAEIARIAAEIDAAYDEPPTVSIVGAIGGASPFAVPDSLSATAALLRKLGLGRPEAQQVEVEPELPFIFFSEETLLDHDADFIFALADGGFYGDGISELSLAPSLTGVTTNISGEFWFASFPFAVAWILADIEAVLLGDGEARTGADVLDHWDAYIG